MSGFALFQYTANNPTWLNKLNNSFLNISQVSAPKAFHTSKGLCFRKVKAASRKIIISNNSWCILFHFLLIFRAENKLCGELRRCFRILVKDIGTIFKMVNYDFIKSSKEFSKHLEITSKSFSLDDTDEREEEIKTFLDTSYQMKLTIK